jgi:glucose-1-phosphate adenylyltransferase
MTALHQETSHKSKEKLLSNPSFPCDMSRVATIVLAGGQGARLFPLTHFQSKPAIPFGGKYRLIDIPLSNAIHSGSQKIFIITQFLAKSLHDYIYKIYPPSLFSTSSVEILSVEEKPQGKAWFQGTADAIRQNLDYLKETPADYFLILSGDQLYQMNFQKMMQTALQTNADVVIAALPVEESQAHRLGILRINAESRITHFVEKPQEKEHLQNLRMEDSLCEKFQFNPGNYLGSMGIYLFKRKTLMQILMTDMREDFGKHLIPALIEKGNATAFLHEGYWEDIGTIQAYYNANMALLSDAPSFNCNDEKSPLFTHHQNLPPTRLGRTLIHNSLICEGSIIDAEEISHSILGSRTKIKKGTVIRCSYLMGNDFYQAPGSDSNLPQNLQIGENCLIEGAIIDKHVCIGDNVQLINRNKLSQFNSDEICIRDGIIVVQRGANIPDGFSV